MAGYALEWGLASLTLAPWRRAKEAHWTERARLLYGPRLSAALNPWLIAAMAAVVVKFFADGSICGVVMVGAAAALAGAVWGSYRFDREIWRGLNFKEWIRHNLMTVVFRLGTFVILAGAATMPAHWNQTAAIIAALVLLFSIAQSFGLAMGILRACGLVQPAPERLAGIATQAAARAGTHLRGAWIIPGPTVNAFALLGTQEVLFTEPLLTVMSDEELAALSAHEAAHLGESRWVLAALLAASLTFYPFIFIRPLMNAPSVIGLLAVAAVIFLMPRLANASGEEWSFQADSAGAREAVEPLIYARALEKLYQGNQMPAAMSKGKHRAHPDLYDRMISAGITPDYPRPQPPRSVAWSTWLLVAIAMWAWSCCRTLCDCIEPLPQRPRGASPGKRVTETKATKREAREEIALPRMGLLWQVNAAVKPTWRNWQTR